MRKETGKYITTKLTLNEAKNTLRTSSIINWKNALEMKTQQSNNSCFKLSDDNIKLNTPWFAKLKHKPNRKKISIINRIRRNHHRTKAHLYKQ